jgi:hypothetical protein
MRIFYRRLRTAATISWKMKDYKDFGWDGTESIESVSQDESVDKALPVLNIPFEPCPVSKELEAIELLRKQLQGSKRHDATEGKIDGVVGMLKSTRGKVSHGSYVGLVGLYWLVYQYMTVGVERSKAYRRRKTQEFKVRRGYFKTHVTSDYWKAFAMRVGQYQGLRYTLKVFHLMKLHCRYRGLYPRGEHNPTNEDVEQKVSY